MVNIITKIPDMLRNFLKGFRDIFIRPSQFDNFSIYTNGLFLQLNRLSLQTIDNCRLRADYEGLQHFLSDSPWDEKELNTRRIELLQQDKRTRSNSKGALIIDDTSSKKSGKKTEGCKLQYSGRDKALTNCNVVVTSHYVDQRRDFGVNLLPYVPADEFERGKKDPEFLSKVKLAKRLVKDAREKGIDFGEVLIDNWYLCKEIVEFLEGMGYDWFSTLESNRVLFRAEKKMTVKKLVATIAPTAFQKVVMSYKDGSEKTKYFWGATVTIKGLRSKQRVVVLKPDVYTEDMKEIDVYVTNNIYLKDKEIIYHFGRRWKIEDFYRDAKDNLHFDQFQVRTLKAITRHWYMVILAHTFLILSKVRGSFSHFIKDKMESIGELLRSFRRISLRGFLKWINGKRNFNILWKYLQGGCLET